MGNMDIYNRVRSVPTEATKPFTNGRFSGTDVNPMWRIKALTEQFGPCGIGWYFEVLSERCEEHGDVTISIVDINLYIKVDGEWSKPIFGTGGNQLVTAKGMVSDEGYKMALTDALSVACKHLGVAADVYFAKDADFGTKYSRYETPESNAAPPRRETRKKEPEIPAIEVPEVIEMKENALICADCGKTIQAVGKVDIMSLISGTLRTYGRQLCWDCASKAKMARNNKEEKENA